MPINDNNARQGAAYNVITNLLLMPIFTASLGYAIYLTVHRRADNPVVYPWLILLFAALIALNMQSRFYALRLQDRVIRLEETMRLMRLMPSEPISSALLEALTPSQLIGLRFASDAELPGLAARAGKEGLSQKAIKEAITVWRRDDVRV